MLLTHQELGDVSDNYKKFMKVLRENVKANGLPWNEQKPV